MSHAIPPDDLHEDMWVCIREHPEEEAPLPNFLFHAGHSAARRRRAAIVPGRPMRILAVDLPFIHVAPIDREGDEMGPYILDSREQPLVRSHEDVANRYREFNRGRRAAIRERVARERHEDAMQQVDIEIARHRKLLLAGLVAGRPTGAASEVSDDDTIYEVLKEAPEGKAGTTGAEQDN